MTITVRLPVEIEADLRARVDTDGAALSKFVREAIAEKLQREQPKKRCAYELGKHLFGQHGSGQHDLSSDRKAVLSEGLDAKHHRRRRSAGRVVRSG